MPYSLITDKIDYAIAKKLEIAELLNLEGNPTWDDIISALETLKDNYNVGAKISTGSLNPSVSIDQYNITGLRRYGYLTIAANQWARSALNASAFQFFKSLELLWDENSDAANTNGINIPDTCFKYHPLEKVVLTAKIWQIGANAFNLCNQLKTLVLSQYITSIGASAFSNCSQLNSIKFLGTIAEWNAIPKGTNWNSGVPATVVHCSDGNVNL